MSKEGKWIKLTARLGNTAQDLLEVGNLVMVDGNFIKVTSIENDIIRSCGWVEYDISKVTEIWTKTNDDTYIRRWRVER